MEAACNGENELQTEEHMKLVIEPNTPVLKDDIIESGQAKNEIVSWKECNTIDDEDFKDVLSKNVNYPIQIRIWTEKYKMGTLMYSHSKTTIQRI